MKMLKKILCILALGITLNACGDSDSESKAAPAPAGALKESNSLKRGSYITSCRKVSEGKSRKIGMFIQDEKDRIKFTVETYHWNSNDCAEGTFQWTATHLAEGSAVLLKISNNQYLVTSSKARVDLENHSDELRKGVNFHIRSEGNNIRLLMTKDSKLEKKHDLLFLPW